MESLGYLFMILFLLAGFGFSVVSFVAGCRKNSIRAKWLGGIVAFVCILLTVEVVFKVIFEDNLEMNPWINNDAEVVGTWADQGAMLTLATNHTFNYLTSARTVNGTWARDDWNLRLNGSNFGAIMRFVQFRGRFRLMTHPPEGEPTMWDDVGLSRK
jgi:hypothetical protein